MCSLPLSSIILSIIVMSRIMLRILQSSFMFNALTYVSGVWAILELSAAVVGYSYSAYIVRPVSYVRLYGISGFLVGIFGAKNVWDMQAEVLGSRKDETAMAFRKSVQDESTTCAVAVVEPLAPSVNS